MMKGKPVTNSERFKAFDNSEIETHKKKYAAEAESKYAGTDAWKESIKKTSKYTETDWTRITESGNAVLGEIAVLMF